MKKENNIIIILLLLIIAILAALCVLFATNKLSFNTNNTTTNDNKTELNNNETNNNKTEINKEKTNNDTNNSKTEDKSENTKLTLTGTYTDEKETKDYYHKSEVTITNQTDNSIDFKISAMHGTDKERVNIGNVNGTAKKTGEYTYQFEETKDGKTSTITFIFTFHRMFTYLEIKESYPDNINPYGGNRVYFSGNYIQT